MAHKSGHGCKCPRTICNGKCHQARNAKEKYRKPIAHRKRQANEQDEEANRQAAAWLAHQERARANTRHENVAKALIMAPPQRSGKTCPILINEKARDIKHYHKLKSLGAKPPKDEKKYERRLPNLDWRPRRDAFKDLMRNSNLKWRREKLGNWYYPCIVRYSA